MDQAWKPSSLQIPWRSRRQAAARRRSRTVIIMADLFPIVVEHSDIPDIPGLTYRPSYVSEGEELRLAAAIDGEPWDTTWERRRQLYGASYGSNTATDRPIPGWASHLIEEFMQEGITE